MTWQHDELGAGGMPVSSQDMKLRGVVVKTRFKRIEQCGSRQKNLCSRLFHSGFCTFGSGISDLGRARRSLALSVLGGEADCVISAHHRGAARLKIELLKIYQKN
jgi:hypothetical protein